MGRVDYFGDPDGPAPNSLVPSVAVLVVRDDEVLLIHKRDNDLWSLPGGAIDVGESAAHAAIRETREETGIEVEIEGLTGLYDDPHTVMAYDDGEVRQQFSLCFRAHATGGAINGQESEVKAVRWVATDFLDALTMNPSHRERTAHALAWTPGSAPYIGNPARA